MKINKLLYFPEESATEESLYDKNIVLLLYIFLIDECGWCRASSQSRAFYHSQIAVSLELGILETIDFWGIGTKQKCLLLTTRLISMTNFGSLVLKQVKINELRKYSQHGYFFFLSYQILSKISSMKYYGNPNAFQKEGFLPFF